MVIFEVFARAVFLPVDAASLAQTVDFMKDCACAVLHPMKFFELFGGLIASVVFAQGALEQAFFVMFINVRMNVFIAHYFIALFFFLCSLFGFAFEG